MACIAVIVALSWAWVACSGWIQVQVCAWDRQVTVYTQARTVGKLLEEVNIQLRDCDVCHPGPETFLSDGMTIFVERAKSITIYDAGIPHVVFTTEKHVKSLLDMANIVPGPFDMVFPGTSEEISDDNIVNVVRVSYGEDSTETQIPFTTERRENGTLEAGLVRVLNPGANGIAKTTFLVRYENGCEVSRQEKSVEIIKEPIHSILSVGTLQVVSRDGETIRFEKAIEVKATAYCACTVCCGRYANGYTYLGLPAERGVIAVDPQIIPLGTRVYVEGYGPAIAADTGGAIKRNRIDVCFNTHEEAVAWGVKNLKVYLLP